MQTAQLGRVFVLNKKDWPSWRGRQTQGFLLGKQLGWLVLCGALISSVVCVDIRQWVSKQEVW